MLEKYGVASIVQEMQIITYIVMRHYETNNITAFYVC